MRGGCNWIDHLSRRMRFIYTLFQPQQQGSCDGWKVLIESPIRFHGRQLHATFETLNSFSSFQIEIPWHALFRAPRYQLQSSIHNLSPRPQPHPPLPNQTKPHLPHLLATMRPTQPIRSGGGKIPYSSLPSQPPAQPQWLTTTLVK